MVGPSAECGPGVLVIHYTPLGILERSFGCVVMDKTMYRLQWQLWLNQEVRPGEFSQTVWELCWAGFETRASVLGFILCLFLTAACTAEDAEI
jgi:hypothetical protein